MDSPAKEIARRLGEQAEAVCRRYLAGGRREGHYWLVGDVRGSPGRSLYVRLADGDGGRSAGKWTDAATGDHGDLLDVIAASCGHARLGETLAEARSFLSLPVSENVAANPRPYKVRGSPEAARRLLAAARPIAGTLAASYLATRRITLIGDHAALRFHPHCFYRPSQGDAPETRPGWPALIAAVTDKAGTVTGVHRTWLALDGRSKAPVASPRRAMGHLLGHGVRFGAAGPVMAFGEGIETVQSAREVLPSMPMVAGLSAAHLAAIEFPDMLRRLYVLRDADPAGDAALAALHARGEPAGIEVVVLEPAGEDFNEDLMRLGCDRLGGLIRRQLHAGDARQFLRGA